MTKDEIAAIRARHEAVEQAQLDLVRELAAANEGPRVEGALLTLQRAYRDSHPDLVRLLNEVDP